MFNGDFFRSPLGSGLFQYPWAFIRVGLIYGMLLYMGHVTGRLTLSIGSCIKGLQAYSMERTPNQ